MAFPSQIKQESNTNCERTLSFRQRVRELPIIARFVLILVIFVFGCLLYMVARSPYMAWRHWCQAVQFNEAHEWESARQHWHEYLQIFPTSGAAHFQLARTCRREGDLDTAKVHLLKARQLGLDMELASLEYRLMDVQNGIKKPHIGLLQKHIENKNETNTCVFEAFIVGSLLVNSQGAAYELCDLWQNRYPDDWQPFYWRGRLFEQSLLHAKAVEQYQAALKQKPVIGQVHLRLAHALLFLGRFPEALPHCQFYLEKHPELAQALLLMARCEHGMGQGEKARASLRRLLAGNPKSGDGLFLLGRLELEAGNPELAAEKLKKAESLLPANMEICQLIVSALKQLDGGNDVQQYITKRKNIERDLRRVAELIKEINYKKPNDVDLRCDLGKTFIRLRNYDDGIRWLITGLLIDANHEPSKKALREHLPKLGDRRVTSAYHRFLNRK